MFRWFILLLLLLNTTFAGYAQSKQDGLERILAYPAKLNKSLDDQQERINSKIEQQTVRYLRKLQKQEHKLHRKLVKQDSSLASSLQLGNDSMYNSWKQVLSIGNNTLEKLPGSYSGKIDSMTMALGFLEKNPNLAVLTGSQFSQLKSQYEKFGASINETEHLKKLLHERKAFLKEKLGNLPLGKTWSKYQKQAIYYQQQLAEYRRILDEPNLWEKKVLEVLREIPSFRKFFDKYSVLGSMFRLPGQNDEFGIVDAITGLQTRQSVIQEITQRMGSLSTAQQAMSAGVQAGQVDLASLKEKLSRSLISGESLEMPGFVPNQEKSHSFLKRVEIGTNLQTVRSNNLFPVTSDIGLSVGYKINVRSIIGIGLSYKLGWGKDIRHIKISHEGFGLRSFFDMKIRNNFWLTAGGEWNYRSQFNSLIIFKDLNQWQQSVLIGIQRKQTIKKYKSTVSILYDALWNKHNPTSQPVVFRIGYNF